MSNKTSIVLILLFTIHSMVFSISNSHPQNVNILIRPDQNKLMTKTIQQAIDECAEKGGGTVVFSAGTFRENAHTHFIKITF